VCDTRTLFARHGIRCTKQRRELYNALARSKKHPTAEELYDVVKNLNGGMSLTTVYNTLETFCERALCRRIPTCDGKARYDADLRHHLHVTTTDGQVRDVPEDLGARLLESLPRSVLAEIEQRMGVVIQRVGVEFVAERCGQNSTEPDAERVGSSNPDR